MLLSSVFSYLCQHRGNLNWEYMETCIIFWCDDETFSSIPSCMKKWMSTFLHNLLISPPSRESRFCSWPSLISHATFPFTVCSGTMKFVVHGLVLCILWIFLCSLSKPKLYPCNTPVLVSTYVLVWLSLNPLIELGYLTCEPDIKLEDCCWIGDNIERIWKERRRQWQCLTTETKPVSSAQHFLLVLHWLLELYNQHCIEVSCAGQTLWTRITTLNR